MIITKEALDTIFPKTGIILISSDCPNMGIGNIIPIKIEAIISIESSDEDNIILASSLDADGDYINIEYRFTDFHIITPTQDFDTLVDEQAEYYNKFYNLLNS